LPTTLPPLGRTATTRWRRRRRSVARAGGSRGAAAASGAAAELALDESERGLSVDRAVALVHVGVVAGAAVGVGAVAVALDFAGGLLHALAWGS
jgi:hypothetical protein